MYSVVLSEHAIQRLIQYFGSWRWARYEISMRLTSTLRLGVKPNENLSVEVRIRDGFRAACHPVDEGVWVVATVIPPEDWDGTVYEVEKGRVV